MMFEEATPVSYSAIIEKNGNAKSYSSPLNMVNPEKTFKSPKLP